jgi:hypothetical protein
MSVARNRPRLLSSGDIAAQWCNRCLTALPSLPSSLVAWDYYLSTPLTYYEKVLISTRRMDLLASQANMAYGKQTVV